MVIVMYDSMVKYDSYGLFFSHEIIDALENNNEHLFFFRCSSGFRQSLVPRSGQIYRNAEVLSQKSSVLSKISIEAVRYIHYT